MMESWSYKYTNFHLSFQLFKVTNLTLINSIYYIPTIKLFNNENFSFYWATDFKHSKFPCPQVWRNCPLDKDCPWGGSHSLVLLESPFKWVTRLEGCA